MKNNHHHFLLLFLLLPFFLTAQQDQSLSLSACFSDQLHQKMLDENPAYALKHRGMERQLYQLNQIGNRPSTRSATQPIPVVVHIVHQNGAENISDQQVFNALRDLNEAFENVGIYDSSTGVDVGIEFCLAARDVDNNSSDGINRIESSLTSVIAETQDLALKDLLRWNPRDYLNIWVVREISSTSAGAGVLGYATLPSAHGFAKDGIVVEASYFGSTQDRSKVLVHEAGHYLGLYHTFEGGCRNENCQTDGDRVCDTPPDHSTAPVDCGAAINTCTTDENDASSNNPFRSVALGGLGDQNDMYINYMDYGHLPCYSAFTEGQKTRMTDALCTARKSLLESYGCLAPCPLAAFEASFNTAPASPVPAGEPVSFTNTSDPADVYRWSVDQQEIATTLNTTHTFEEEGMHTVSLEIRDTINNCRDILEQSIEVICEGEASFTSSTTDILAGETVDFSNTSTGNLSYQWFLDGTAYSTDTDLSISFPTPGFYTVHLVGMTATCSNVSTTITIQVGSCTDGDKSQMHWYFGEFSALDFNSGEPVLVPDSQLEVFEGSACISDDNGQLLFYTDGESIWDATNTVMPNGTDLLGGSNKSAWTQALIVPRPQHPAQYYVFTCDDFENGLANGINYSIVDTTLNGGRGDVTSVKNVFLASANTEAMNATYHKDGQRAWLVIPALDVFNTYLIDSSGISAPLPFSDPSLTTEWAFTQFSHGGKKLVSTPLFVPQIVLFDFDNATGALSDPLIIDPGSDEVWAFEFSPDDSKLYVTLHNEMGDYSLYQFDLSLTTAAQIAASKTWIGDLELFDRLLLAPNGRIYTTVFHTSWLGVVNYPNELGADCDFDAREVNLSPNINDLSIPSFIRGQRQYLGPTVPNVDLGPDLMVCDGLATVLEPAVFGNPDLVWQDGSTEASFTTWLPGTYWVTATNECGSVTDSITITSEDLNLVDLGDDLVLCDEEEVILDAGTLGDHYLWQDGSSNSTFTVSQSGIYSVQVSTAEGCYQEDSITITIDLEAPTAICPTDIDTLIAFGQTSALIHPNPPTITDDCPYSLTNDYTDTDDATAGYPLGTTTITWTVTDANGNSTTCSMQVIVDTMSSTHDPDAISSSIILYPNPSKGIFVLEDKDNRFSDLQLYVVDPLGRKVYERSTNLSGKMRIDLSEYSGGVYFLYWASEGVNGVFKMIVD